MAEKTDDLLISISTDLATVRRSLKRLESDISSTTSNVQKQFDGLGKGIDKSMTSAMQTRINAMVGIGAKATKEWTGALSDQGAELERLRGKFNPVFSTITRYKATVAEIQQAHRLGAISADEMTAAIGRERQATLASVAALKQRNAAMADTPSRHGANVGAFQTANLAAQFQDIAVTSAMGMSPLQIALQQGTQLSAVLGPMGATGAVKGLAAAFASVISPVSLVTIGVVAATAAAAQYFMKFMAGSEETTKSLEEQAAVIQTVAARWGAAVPALKKYADELERTKRAAEDVSARNSTIDREFSAASTSLGSFLDQVQSANFSAFNQGAMEMVDNVGRLEIASSEFHEAIKSGKDASDEFARVQELVADVVNSSAIPATGGLRDKVEELAKTYLAAAQAAALAASGFDAIAGAAGKNGRLQGGVLSDQAFNSRFGSGVPGGKEWKDIFPSLFKDAKSGSSGRGSAVSDAEREKKAIDDVIASLQFEQEQIGRTATEQRVYNELKRAGVDLNSEAGKQIAELVAKNAELAESQAKLNKAQQDFNNGLEQLGADAIDALGNVIAGTEDAADAFKKLGIEILKSALTGKGAYSDFFASLSGGQGGGLLGLLGGLFGPAQSSFSFPAGAGLWSDGGYTGPGGKYDPAGLVHKGEYVFDQDAVRAAGGPSALEAFRQSLKGYASGGYVGAPIAPRLQSPANQAISVAFAPSITVQGGGDNAGEQVTEALRKFEREFTPKVVKSLREAKTKGMI
ncbi:phage tail length tape measure family protein [Aminobacter niigataensis]|uniref:phage tail length tape measure family protein n=1 Tax=Aminobacter niigataensis TaxID=83265 RepID=UPI0024CD7F75|nr:phage tail length tape measure family protein [Aminobacter niigataensis]CAI2935014.1 TMP_2 domain-containing protein [Aminobacter niigataensis]